MTPLRGLLLALCLFLAGLASGCSGDGWRNSYRGSAGLAPLPGEHEDAVVQAYAAAVYGWRGAVADHTWVVVKPKGAGSYRRYEVIGWRLRSGRPVVVESSGIPDRYWYGAAPTLLVDVRGDAAEAMIPRIVRAAACYPYPDRYTAFPGPNSNSFTQWIALVVPELGLELPWRALGKNWMAERFEPPDSSATGASTDPSGRCHA